MAFRMGTTILILGVVMLIVPACGIVEELVSENAPSLQTIDKGHSFSIWCNFSMTSFPGYTVIWKKAHLLNDTDMRPIYMLRRALLNITKPLNNFIGRNISETCTKNGSHPITINCLIQISNANYWDGGNYTCYIKPISYRSSSTSVAYQTVRVIVPPTSVHISKKAATSTSIILECVISYLYLGEHPAHDILWYTNGNLSHVTLAKDVKCNSLNSSLCQTFSAMINESKVPSKRYQCGSADIRSEVFISNQIDDSTDSTYIPEPTKWIRIVPESKVNSGYIHFWSILLLLVAVLLGLPIIIIIVCNRRKRASRAVHSSRQKTRTNRRRRRDALKLNVEGLIYADLDIIGTPPKRTTFIDREKTEYVQIRRV